jgi:hypothetical protein
LTCCVQSKDKVKENTIQEFYDDGRLKTEYTINDDSLKHGIFKMFYNNGIKKEELAYSNGYLFGEQFFYNEEGDITKYSVVDGFDDVIYVLKFDDKGDVIKEDGMVVSPNVYCPNCKEGTVTLLDTVLFNGMVSIPPSKTIIVKLKVIEPNGQIKIDVIKVYKNNVIAFQEIFQELGSYQFEIVGTLLSANGDIYKIDTVRKQVEVISR